MEVTEKSRLRKEIKKILNSNSQQFEEWSNIICKKILNTDEYKQCTNILAYMALSDEPDILQVIKQAVKDGKKVFIPRIIPETSEMDFYEFQQENCKTGSFGISEPTGVCPLFTLNSNSVAEIPGDRPLRSLQTKSITEFSPAPETSGDSPLCSLNSASTPVTPGDRPQLRQPQQPSSAQTYNSVQPIRTLVLVPGRAFTKHGDRLGRGKGYYDTYLIRLLNEKGGSASSKVALFGICFRCQLLAELPVEAHDIKMDLIISQE